MEVGCEALSNSKEVLEHAVPRPPKTTRKYVFFVNSISVMIIDFEDTFLHDFSHLIRVDMSGNINSEPTCVRMKFLFFYKKIEIFKN